MAIPTQRDPEETGKQLTGWLQKALSGGSDVVVSNVEVPRSGFSNETLYFDAAWTEENQRRRERLVARVQPGGHQLFLDADVFLQYRMMEALAPSPVPVPELFWAEREGAVLGRPFFVMGRVEGQVPTVLPSYHAGGWVADRPPADRERLALNGLAALVQIGQTSGAEFDFLRPSGAKTCLRAYLEWVGRWAAWASGGRALPVIDDALAYVVARAPDDDAVSVVWGDATVTNMIFGKDLSVGAVIDWEMATLGPPQVDLGWWLFWERFLTEGMGCPQLDGIPGRTETIAAYESLRGQTVGDMEYYEILGALRMAIIIVRNIAIQVEDGLASPETTMDTHNPVTRILAEWLGLPVPDLAPEYAAMVARVQEQ